MRSILSLKLLSILAISVAPKEATAKPISLTLLEDQSASCMDGTLSGYYFDKSTTFADRKKWVFYLQGGGECDNEQSCKAQLQSALGSSYYFPNTSDNTGWYLASGECTDIPLCTWNHVNIPYCSQDLFSGQITKPSDQTWGLYFSGHLIFKAVIDAFERELSSATDIILLGASAGGIGVWMNVDYLAERFPKAKVTAATVAGFYFYATYYTGTNATSPGGMADFREEAWINTYALYDAYVDQSCKMALASNPQACMLSNYSFPYIESQSFSVQAQTDSVVLTGHDCFPDEYKFESEEQAFMKNFDFNMSVALKPMLDMGNSRSGNSKFITGYHILQLFLF